MKFFSLAPFLSLMSLASAGCEPMPSDGELNIAIIRDDVLAATPDTHVTLYVEASGCGDEALADIRLLQDDNVVARKDPRFEAFEVEVADLHLQGPGWPKSATVVAEMECHSGATVRSEPYQITPLIPAAAMVELGPPSVDPTSFWRHAGSFFGCSEGRLIRYDDAGTAHEASNAPVPGCSRAAGQTRAVDGGFVILDADGGRLSLLSPDLTVRWSPSWDDRRVRVGVADDRIATVESVGSGLEHTAQVTAFDPITGSELWNAVIPGESGSAFEIVSDPAFDRDGRVILLAGRAKVVDDTLTATVETWLVSAETVERVSTHVARVNQPAGSISTFVFPKGVVFPDGHIAIIAELDTLRGLDLESGDELWSESYEGGPQVSETGDSVTVSSDGYPRWYRGDGYVLIETLHALTWLDDSGSISQRFIAPDLDLDRVIAHHPQGGVMIRIRGADETLQFIDVAGNSVWRGTLQGAFAAAFGDDGTPYYVDGTGQVFELHSSAQYLGW